MSQANLALPRFLALVACGTSVAAPVCAQIARASGKLPMTIAADLVGEGKRETATVQARQKAESVTGFTLAIGTSKISVTLGAEAGMEQCEGLRIVQVDGDSHARQVIVVLSGPDDIQEDYVFGFDGRQIFKIGMVPASATVPGNGAIYADHWMQFWDCKLKYAADLKARTLRFVPQPLYFVGQSAMAAKSFPIRRDQAASSAVVANVAPGSTFTVVVYQMAKSPENDSGGGGWYLLKTQTGLCGWAQLTTFQDKQHGLTFAD